MASVYTICVSLIARDKRRGGVTESTIEKIDKYFALDKLTENEYDALQAMIGGADE